MPNTSTLLNVEKDITVCGFGPIYQIKTSIDTPNSDHIVVTPGGTILNMLGQVITTGIITNKFIVASVDFVDSTAVNLTIKSGSTVIHNMELSTFQGKANALDINQYLFSAVKAPDSLIINSSGAGPTTILWQIIFKRDN